MAVSLFVPLLLALVLNLPKCSVKCYIILDVEISKEELLYRREREVCENPTVQIKQGTIQGRCVQSRTGMYMFTYLGIPYAKPPLGQLRFKDAVLEDGFIGVLNATKQGSVCPQRDIQFSNTHSESIVGDEDCLYMNIFTPPAKDGALFPVMVWIHAGNFAWGSGNHDVYGPDYIVSEGIVLVTFNYRLGPLGFLYMKEAAPGNAGLKDQVVALRWIQKNIEAFGGDPEQVTIFGGGSGGASAQLLQHSDISQGLFSAVIAQSGNAVSKWAYQHEPEETSRRLARAVGCDQQDAEAAVNCMRDVDVETLIEKACTDAPVEEYRKRMHVWWNAFKPTVDYPVDGVEQFLTEPIVDLVRKQGGPLVPTLAGVNNMESMFFFLDYDFYNEEEQKKLDNSWKDIILPELILPINISRTDEALEDIRNHFMDNKPLTNATLPQFLYLLTNLLIAGFDYSLPCTLQNPSVKTYAYYFVADDQLNFLKPKLPVQLPGASHSDELGYIFAIDGLSVPDESSAAYIRKRMVSAWTQFAKNREIAGWVPYNIRDESFTMEIGNETIPRAGVRQDDINFWNNFYDEFSPDMPRCVN